MEALAGGMMMDAGVEKWKEDRGTEVLEDIIAISNLLSVSSKCFPDFRHYFTLCSFTVSVFMCVLP